jgi:hypothetical protein
MNQEDTLIRHFLQRGTRDPKDGLRHSAKVAWRALALLQLEIEADEKAAAFGSGITAHVVESVNADTVVGHVHEPDADLIAAAERAIWEAQGD